MKKNDGFGEDESSELARKIRDLYPSLKPSNKGQIGKSIEKLFRYDPESEMIPPTGWLDHSAINGDTFISEPYGVGMDNLKQLISFCEENKLSFFISAQSWHFLFSTIRIVLKKVRPE